MRPFRKLFFDYVYELSTADVFMTADQRIRFNCFRSRKMFMRKLLGIESHLVDALEEMEKWSMDTVGMLDYCFSELEQMFYWTENNLIWHRHYFIQFSDSLPINGVVGGQLERLVSAYCTIQHESLQRMKHLLISKPQFIPGMFEWKEEKISFYELFNVLWDTETIGPVGKALPKKEYLRYFSGILGLKDLPETYNIRIYQSVNRQNIVRFLTSLINKYSRE